MSSKKQSNRPEKIQADKLIGQVTHRYTGALTDKESIMYSLSVGFSQDPLKEDDFKYTSDVHEDFCAFPTVGGVSHHVNFISPLMTSQNIPKFKIHIILHAEQKFEMVKERINIGVDYYHQCKIVDCIDKGSNAIVWYEVRSYQIVDGKQELAFLNTVGVFLRGLGGFGFKGKKLVQSLPSVPERKPDIVKKVQTYPNQSFFYRLTGDRNPLHVDPKVSSAAKFQRPIIHGMATYGSVARVIVQQVLGNDPTRFKKLHNRFTGHVFPGQSLTLNLWRNGENEYIYQAVTDQRNTKVLVGIFEARPAAKL